MNNGNGRINIHGKEYKTVALRIKEFREVHPDYTIDTKLVEDGERVIIKTTIMNEQGRILATGYAEEVRDDGHINRTSALENCETSSVGRALAFLGFGGEEIASANEVSDAIIAGIKKDMADYMAKYSRCLQKHISTVLMVKEAIRLKEQAH